MALLTTDGPCALPVAKSTLVTFCTRGVLVCGVFFQAVHANALLSCGVRSRTQKATYYCAPVIAPLSLTGKRMSKWPHVSSMRVGAFDKRNVHHKKTGCQVGVFLGTKVSPNLLGSCKEVVTTPAKNIPTQLLAIVGFFDRPILNPHSCTTDGPVHFHTPVFG